MAERDRGASGPSVGSSQQTVFRTSVLLTLLPSGQVTARVSTLLYGKHFLLIFVTVLHDLYLYR